MCGRYTNTFSREELNDHFDVLWRDELPARYNVAPTQIVPIVRMGEHGREVAFVKWGLIPYWAKDPAIAARLINARGESLMDKPAFRDAYRRHHCLVPASSFYEWKTVGGRKQPYCIQVKGAALFGMGGLWERWTDPAGNAVETCTIITTDANELVGQLHDRMPLILQPGNYGAWLDSGNSRAAELLKPFPAEMMRLYPVSTYVNKASNDDPRCIEPIELPDT